jgi:hypothetical protein
MHGGNSRAKNKVFHGQETIKNELTVNVIILLYKIQIRLFLYDLYTFVFGI